MIFRKLRGVNLPYREQGLIWFTCVNYDKQRKPVKEKINRMCRKYVSARTLYRRRKDFYESWNREREGD